MTCTAVENSIELCYQQAQVAHGYNVYKLFTTFYLKSLSITFAVLHLYSSSCYARTKLNNLIYSFNKTYCVYSNHSFS